MAILGVGTGILVTGGIWIAESYPYHPVVEAYSFGPVSDDREEVEITNYQSFKAGTTLGFREYVPGLRTDAELEFEANYSGDEYINWHVAKDQSNKLSFHTVYPDYYYHSFNGTVKGVDLTIPVDDRMTYTISTTITEALTFESNLTPLFNGIAAIPILGSSAIIDFHDFEGITADDAPVNAARQIEYLLNNKPDGKDLQIIAMDGTTPVQKVVSSITPVNGEITIEGSWGFVAPQTTYTLEWVNA